MVGIEEWLFCSFVPYIDDYAWRSSLMTFERSACFFAGDARGLGERATAVQIPLEGFGEGHVYGRVILIDR